MCGIAAGDISTSLTGRGTVLRSAPGFPGIAFWMPPSFETSSGITRPLLSVRREASVEGGGYCYITSCYTVQHPHLVAACRH